jgi:hypothetical protein
LFLTLVVLNLAFFAWAQWIDVPSDAVRPASSAGVPTLQLVNAAAAPTATPTATPTAPEPQPAPTPAARCRSFGPFDDAAAASGVSERLRARGWQPRARSAQGQVLDGYWVYLSDLKDPAAVRGALARLSAAGIHDAATMTAPEPGERVSVGFFADQAHAVRRAEQVRALGFKPTLDVHERSASQQWLDIELTAGDPEPVAAELLAAAPAAAAPNAAANANASLPQFVPCPAGGTGG